MKRASKRMEVDHIRPRKGNKVAGDEMVGRRFKNWLVLGRAANDKHQKKRYRCRCEGCGKEREVNAQDLRRGRTGGCFSCKTPGAPCARREQARIEDMIGARFGSRIVLAHLGKIRTHKNIYWECQCDCGRLEIVNSYQLRNTLSCVRLNGEKQRRYVGTHPTMFFHRWLASYRNKPREFKLSSQEFLLLIDSPCHYCNLPPELRTLNVGTGRVKQTDRVSGLDRVNSAEGYHLSNVVPCCTKCNRMKLDYTIEDFLSHIRRIAIHQGWIKEEA